MAKIERSDLNKKILYTGLSILFIFFVTGIIWVNSAPKAEEYNFPSPEKVAEQYFAAWNNKNYADMYAAFSDGFKKIDPTAKTLQDFKEYADSQNIESVEVIDIEETSNDGQTASVDYEVIFILSNGQKSNYKGTFTLKYRKGDIIQGWKLIHPYGENI